MGQRVLILGAAGRDFHNFNTFFRGNRDYDVVAFTAAQIPNIDDRVYPAALAGEQYPDGIPILPESELEQIIRDRKIDIAVFSYSDVSYDFVMSLASRVMAAGADHVILGPEHTMIQARKPVISVCATRTGSGKSQTSRYIAAVLRSLGKQVVLIRHPMPYGDLVKQRVQRFADPEDFVRHDVTIEEREEYEPIVAAGHVVYAGVDYDDIVREAEREADVIVWDGGNNDYPFYRPDLAFAVVDTHRPDHALHYHPGELNVRLADVVILNKVSTATAAQLELARKTTRQINPRAKIVLTESPITVDDPAAIKGKKAIVVEDGPTLTHGGMKYGAGWLAAEREGASEIIDPRPYAVGSIKVTYDVYPETGPVLPAMGYGAQQTKDLEDTIDASPADVVVVGTPIDLGRVISLSKPSVRARYELKSTSHPTVDEIVRDFVEKLA